MTFTDFTQPPCFYNMSEVIFLPGVERGVGVLSLAARRGNKHLCARRGCGSAGGPSRSSLRLGGRVEHRGGRCPPVPCVKEQPSPWAHPVCLFSCPSWHCSPAVDPQLAAVRGLRCSSGHICGRRARV